MRSLKLYIYSTKFFLSSKIRIQKYSFFILLQQTFQVICVKEAQLTTEKPKRRNYNF